MLASILLLVFSVQQLRARDLNINPDDYCRIQCPMPGDRHTICEFRCEIAPECIQFQEIELDDNERRIILHAHNYHRNLVASGQDTRGGNAPAKDMRELYYDKELEIPVSCWGRRCRFEHDRCRHTPSYPSAGQNLYLQSSSMPIDGRDPGYLNTSVKEWYEEIKDTNPNILSTFTPIPNAQVGHFTQMVWGDTAVMGCTRVTYESTDPQYLRFNFHLLCNYSPAGNILGYKAYARGAGCGGQLSRSTNQKYSHLCADKAFKRRLGARGSLSKPSETTAPPQAIQPSQAATPPQATPPPQTAIPPQATQPSQAATPPQATQPSKAAAPPQATQPSQSAAPPQATQLSQTAAPAQASQAPKGCQQPTTQPPVKCTLPSMPPPVKCATQPIPPTTPTPPPQKCLTPPPIQPQDNKPPEQTGVNMADKPSQGTGPGQNDASQNTQLMKGGNTKLKDSSKKQDDPEELKMRSDPIIEDGQAKTHKNSIFVILIGMCVLIRFY